MLSGKRVITGTISVLLPVVVAASTAWACSAIGSNGEATDPLFPMTLNPPEAVTTAGANPVSAPFSVPVTVTALWPTVDGNYLGVEKVYMESGYSSVNGTGKSQRVTEPGDCMQVANDSTDIFLGEISWGGTSAVGQGVMNFSPPVMSNNYVKGVFEVCAGALNDEVGAENRPKASSLRAWFAFI